MPKHFDPSEHYRPSESEQKALAARWVPILSSMMNPLLPAPLKVGVTLTVCSDILSNLASYTRLPIPERPTEIDGYVDVQLADKVRFIQASSRATSDDRELVAAFASWRYAVFVVESKNAGRCEVLLWAFVKLSAVAAAHQEQANDLRQLEVFLAVEWNVELASVPTLNEQSAIARYAASEREALPSGLRDLGHTLPSSRRAGEPTRVGKSWVNEFEDQQG